MVSLSQVDAVVYVACVAVVSAVAYSIFEIRGYAKLHGAGIKSAQVMCRDPLVRMP